VYREPANIHKTLYPDSKNHAVPSLHRDSFSAKVPGSVPGAASGNAYYHNRRAVSSNNLDNNMIDYNTNQLGSKNIYNQENLYTIKICHVKTFTAANGMIE